MATPKAIILTGYGINCDRETAYAFQKAGAEARRVHINDLIDGYDQLDRYQILAFPGGFSYGDDISSGKVLANRVKAHLTEPLTQFIDKGGLVIGICNGFQVMIKCGLLGSPDGAVFNQAATLTYNDSNRYEDRWVYLRPEGDRCVFTRGIKTLYLPIAHGEGKFFAPPPILQDLEQAGCVTLRYSDEAGGPADRRFPLNPNGSLNDIAGICDPSGRIFGLMPHPERFLFFTQHPYWTRLATTYKAKGEALPREGLGMQIFRNAVTYFSD